MDPRLPLFTRPNVRQGSERVVTRSRGSAPVGSAPGNSSPGLNGIGRKGDEAPHRAMVATTPVSSSGSLCGSERPGGKEPQGVLDGSLLI